MKTPIIFSTFLLAFLSLSSFSQIDFLSDTNINTCSEVINLQTANLDLSTGQSIITICPSINTLKAKVVIQSLSLSANNSFCVYDGADTNSVLIGCYTSLNQTQFTSSASCLTFVLNDLDTATTSDQALINAQISCTDCQFILPQAVVNSSEDMVIDICLGDELSFVNQTTYPDNNINYSQSNATSTYVWSFFNSTSTQENPSKVFDTPGLYPILLQVTDVQGCENTSQVLTVRVSGPPSFLGTDTMFTSGCLNDSLSLYGAYTPDTFGLYYGTVGDSAFLDDVVGGQYNVNVEINEFEIGQILTDPSDISSICLNIEHSYIGDLDIRLTCPNGSSIELVGYPNSGGSTYLGEPIDDDSDLTPGIGYTYCWIESASNGTWDDYIETFNPNTLPEGDYQPNESISDLIGCPLNGNWSITVEDNLFSDNGSIFSWNISFNSDLFPENNQFADFSAEIISSQWQVNNQLLSELDTFIGFNNEIGFNTYSYVLEDEFGCVYQKDFEFQIFDQGENGCPVLEIPNVFTPNQDGVNDQFTIFSVGAESYDIKVFNRWGKLVYECATVGHPSECAWDGLHENGQKLNDGTYYYIIRALDAEGKDLDIIKSKGAVSILN